jgi:valyl-tRNA synthetase
MRLFSTKPDFKKEAEEKYFEYGRLESSIYKWWEEQGYFQPAPDNGKKPYVVPMPPPNVTGYLHMGHAMFVALQDIMARFHRMRGEPTLWLPGTDHAGIATQLLVERQLKLEGLSRQEIGREKFLERVWAWKEEKGGFIINQMRRLGASADWTREKFTLDPQMSESVVEAFVRLHEKGLVYRGDYMVNWSPGLQTSVSDLEVDYGKYRIIM